MQFRVLNQYKRKIYLDPEVFLTVIVDTEEDCRTFLVFFMNIYLQVTCEYTFAGGATVPQRVHTVVVSLQHSEKVIIMFINLLSTSVVCGNFTILSKESLELSLVQEHAC